MKKRILSLVIISAIIAVFIPVIGAEDKTKDEKATLMAENKPYTNSEFNSESETDFKDNAVIAVMKPKCAILYNNSPSVFDGLGISNIENLDETPAGTPSLYAMENKSGVFKLTLEESGRDNVMRIIDILNSMPEVRLGAA